MPSNDLSARLSSVILWIALEDSTMGRVTVPILLESLDDVYRSLRGEIAADHMIELY